MKATSAGAYPRWLGVAILLLIATTFALNHVAARIAFDHGASVVTGVVFRSSGTALALMLLILLLRVPWRLSTAQLVRGALIGVLIAAQSYCLYASVARLPVALALLTFNTYPMVYTLISWSAGAEKSSPRALIVMSIALFGLALALDIAHTGQEFGSRWSEIGIGVGFAVAAALIFGTVLFLNARWLDGIDGRLRSLTTMTSCGIVVILAAAMTDSFALPSDGAGWAGLLLLTLFYGSAITAFFVVQPHMRATSDVAVLNFEPVALVFLGWAILGQTLSMIQIVGALAVVSAIIMLGIKR